MTHKSRVDFIRMMVHNESMGFIDHMIRIHNVGFNSWVTHTAQLDFRLEMIRKEKLGFKPIMTHNTPVVFSSSMIHIRIVDLILAMIRRRHLGFNHAMTQQVAPGIHRDHGSRFNGFPVEGFQYPRMSHYRLGVGSRNLLAVQSSCNLPEVGQEELGGLIPRHIQPMKFRRLGMRSVSLFPSLVVEASIEMLGRFLDELLADLKGHGPSRAAPVGHASTFLPRLLSVYHMASHVMPPTRYVAEILLLYPGLKDTLPLCRFTAFRTLESCPLSVCGLRLHEIMTASLAYWHESNVVQDDEMTRDSGTDPGQVFQPVRPYRETFKIVHDSSS